jgi:arylsulfatase A-like enzyme
MVRFPRRSSWILASVALLACALAGLSCAGKQKPTNLLVITVDTLRSDRLGCYGYGLPTSPNIDRLAAEGVLFETVCCQAPLTLPSHCSIFTSRYTISHGAVGHAYPLSKDVTTLAEILKASGRSTAAFVSNHVLAAEYGLSRGFDTYWEIHRLENSDRVALKRQNQDPTTEAAIAWLREHESKPFFVWIHWFHPHKPYDPPAEYAARFAGRAGGHTWSTEELNDVWLGTREMPPEEVTRLNRLYDGEVAFSDAQVGIVLEELRRLGVDDRTLVVFTGDHGEVLYEHDRYFGHDLMLYDACMHVPLIIRYRGWSPARIQGQVQSIDIMPTVLALLGVPAEVPLQGKDLGPLVRGQGDATTEIAICQSYPPKDKSLPIFGLRTESSKLILHETEDGFRQELYDLREDPGETRDLSQVDSLRADALEAYYLRWAEAVGTGEGIQEPELDQETLKNLRSLGYVQ